MNEITAPPTAPLPPSAPPAVVLAVQGNYASLREYFFRFRELVHKKIINHRRLSAQEVDFINTHIRSSSEWSLRHASQLYNLLQRFAQDMKPWGHFYDRLVPPALLTNVTTPRPTPPPIVRQQSVTLGEGCFLLYLDFNSRLHTQVKTLFKGRTWDGVDRTWRIPFQHAAALRIFATTYDLTLGESAARMMASYENNLQQSYAQQRVELGLPLKKTLFDFQTVGVDFGIRMRRALIADQMGLGKTPQGIASAVGWNKWPVLVVCPKSLRENWKNEIEAWTDYKALVATPKTMKKLHFLVESQQCHFLIVNYEGVKSHFVTKILPALVTEQKQRPPTVLFNGRERLFHGVLVDEAHECRNPATERYQVMHALMQPLQYRMLLTGTPFVNHVKDLASLVELTGYMDAFGGRKQFMKDFGRVSAKDFAAGSGGAELRALNNRLRTICMIRREKHQVLTQLPDKFRTIVPLELDNRKEYDLAQLSLQEWMRRQNLDQGRINRSLQAEVLTRMQVLKQLSCRGKLRQAQEYVDNILVQGQKVILFVWHRETIAALRRHWPDMLEISGQVKDDQVETNKDLFQRSPHHRLIVITYKRGGVGHTLTAASNVVFLELGWNPKDQDQAEDRAHRIGQKDNVTCHYLVGKSTIDEHIADIINRKRHVGRESVGGTEEVATSVQQLVAQRLLKKL